VTDITKTDLVLLCVPIAFGLLKLKSGRGVLYWIRRISVLLEASWKWLRGEVESVWNRRREEYWKRVREVERNG
jgi:hypothetical protein